MATRLKPLLHKLLSPNQTGFLQHRSILHGFHYAQQVVHSAHKQRMQMAVFKADIFKAFDTLHWEFLSKILTARGFSPTWIDSILNRVLKGTSRIIVNSVAGKKISLKRGVRQGDPISPYLFNIAMDFLARWVQRLNESGFLPPPFPQCKACLLYADDTLLLLKPNRIEMIKVRLIFDIFWRITGLRINLSKSELAITAAPLHLTQSLADIIQCKSVLFPIKYLGLPLSHRRLTKADLSPTLDRIQKALAGWKASLLSIGGRIVLTNAVLSAIPQYIMSVFMLPKWMLKKIDQIRKRFLWHGHKEQHRQQKAIYMVNWTLATMPKCLGGLGIRDTAATNRVLLLKWMWQWYRMDNGWWKSATVMDSASLRPWDDTNASPFWKDLAQLSPLFDCSVTHKIQNGANVRFWHDNWHNSPLKYTFPDLFHSVDVKHSSVQYCILNTSWQLRDLTSHPTAYAQREALLPTIHNIHLAQGHDTIEWLRDSAGFSCSSAYKFLTQVPAPLSPIANLWQIRAPLRVLVFAWLMLKNRLTTTDNLVRRGWNLPSMCIMCAMHEETAQHLFQTCSLARQVRSYVHSTFQPHHALQVTSSDHNLIANSDAPMQLRQIELTTCFVLWRERCSRIFSDKYQSPISLIRGIRLEYAAWFSDSHAYDPG